MPPDERIIVNGVNGRTGEYLVRPLKYSQVAAFVKGEPMESGLVRLLRNLWHKISQPSLGLPFGTDPADVRQAGWGVVFHQDESEAVKEALVPLIEHRQRQVGNDTIFKILTYRGDETRAEWLADHGVSAGNQEPSRVPYYLLLVGSPERIPFEFGHQLAVEYAVGRLHFDTPQEYTAYIDSLIAYERGPSAPNRKEAVFFATRHRFDRSTQLSADNLVDPLAGSKPEILPLGVAQPAGFNTRHLSAERAVKGNLAEIFAPPPGQRQAALLFTATHGVGFPLGDEAQLPSQGALLCQDWPGFGEISPVHYYAAADLPSEAQVHGLVSFHFACYSAGTPLRDRYTHKPGQPPDQIAGRPFIAALPKVLLAHPNGGALACVGHVERAWGYSIVTRNAGPQLRTYQNFIQRVLHGLPVGHAMKDFSERYAALSTSLASLREEIDFGATYSDKELASNWIERNDAEGYLLIGDPAVCLRVDDLTE